MFINKVLQSIRHSRVGTMNDDQSKAKTDGHVNETKLKKRDMILKRENHIAKLSKQNSFN